MILNKKKKFHNKNYNREIGYLCILLIGTCVNNVILLISSVSNVIFESRTYVYMSEIKDPLGVISLSHRLAAISEKNKYNWQHVYL